MHDLQDIMNSRPEVVVPTSDSVWLELPYRDVPNRNTFYPAVTALLKQCKYYHIPFVLFYTPRDSVEWTAFKEINHLPHHVTCSCQYPELPHLN